MKADHDRDRLKLRSIEHGVFLLAASTLQPELITSLGAAVLPVYRQLFSRQAQRSLTKRETDRIARGIGFDD